MSAATADRGRKLGIVFKAVRFDDDSYFAAIISRARFFCPRTLDWKRPQKFMQNMRSDCLLPREALFRHDDREE